MRVQIFEARARAALAAALSRTSARSEQLTSVAKSLSQLEGENVPWARAVATMLRGGLAGANGDHAGASKTLEIAESELMTVDMHLHAAACRLRRGELIGGAEGERLVREASVRFEAEGARNAARRGPVVHSRGGPVGPASSPLVLWSPNL